ncbi:hypothetical protein B0H67DRAFT_666447 [Lasiosphaeris hirsuta]|uniref:Uncharacterized protein n=1 Tax=Lasiosphaeris hirsuta TaxID=260670 RepID=A0AA40AHK8_9PEZI|nr:hypothetical protein B0H67DRAFT_666447 [Lasiosphaeris hirsuta]
MPKMKEISPHSSLVNGTLRLRKEEAILAKEDHGPLGLNCHEKKRLNVWNLAFTESKSRVGRAIKEDNSQELGYLLALARLEDHPECALARLLAEHSGKGFQALLGFCIDFDAIKCLSLLLAWERDLPNSPYRYGHAKLLDRARTLNIQEGRSGCQSLLDPEPKNPGIVNALGLLLAKSPDTIERISKLFAPSMDYYPWLLLHCGSDTVHPGLIEALSAKMPNPVELSRCEKWRGTYISPLTVAAEMLNPSSIGALMRRGAMVFEPFLDAGVLTQANPLFSAVTQIGFAGRASDTMLTSFRSQDPQPAREGNLQAEAWRATLQPSVSRMRTSVCMLLSDTTEFSEATGPYNNMLCLASTCFVFTLRVLMYKTIRSLTDAATQRRLLAADADVPERFRNMASDSNDADSWAFFHDQPGEELYFWDRMWRRGLTAADLRATLRQNNLLLDADFVQIWFQLMTPEMMEEAERLAPKAGMCRPGVLNTDDCLYVLLLALEMDKIPGARRLCAPESHPDYSDFERPSDSQAKMSGRWVTPGYMHGEGPIERVSPSGALSPIDDFESPEPAGPADPVELVEPVEPVEPVDPSDDSLEPTESENEDGSEPEDNEVGDDDDPTLAWLRFQSC